MIELYNVVFVLFLIVFILGVCLAYEIGWRKGCEYKKHVMRKKTLKYEMPEVKRIDTRKSNSRPRTVRY